MKIDNKTRDNLFMLIQSGLELAMPRFDLSKEECASILRVASRQAIFPIVYRGMKQAGVSPENIQEYDQIRLKSEYLAVQHDDALKRIGATLDEEKIPYVILKGAILRNLYPNPLLRTSSDIDILVREEDINHSIKVLEEKTDFRKLKKNYHDISMVSSRVHLELHFNIKENMENVDPILSNVWNYTYPSGDGSQYILLPEFQVFYVIAHMSYHFLNGGLGIRPFIDLWLLNHKTQFDEKQVQELLSQCRLEKFYCECCKLSEVWLGNEKHTDTTSLFELFCLSGGVFGNEKFRIAGAQRNRRGWRYIYGRVFPSKNQVKEFYMDPSGKEHFLPYYYVKRWKSWVSKERRRDLQRRIKATVTSDKKYQDLADELFTKLGFR